MATATLIIFCIGEIFSPAESVYIRMRLFGNVPYDALIVGAAIPYYISKYGVPLAASAVGPRRPSSPCAGVGATRPAGPHIPSLQ